MGYKDSRDNVAVECRIHISYGFSFSSYAIQFFLLLVRFVSGPLIVIVVLGARLLSHR